jgi:hypothetical protein
MAPVSRVQADAAREKMQRSANIARNPRPTRLVRYLRINLARCLWAALAVVFTLSSMPGRSICATEPEPLKPLSGLLHPMQASYQDSSSLTPSLSTLARVTDTFPTLAAPRQALALSPPSAMLRATVESSPIRSRRPGPSSSPRSPPTV